VSPHPRARQRVGRPLSPPTDADGARALPLLVLRACAAGVNNCGNKVSRPKRRAIRPYSKGQHATDPPLQCQNLLGFLSYETAQQQQASGGNNEWVLPHGSVAQRAN